MQTSTPAPTPATPLADIPGLVAGLRRTFDAGRTRPEPWRRVQLERMRNLLAHHEAELLEALRADLGKAPMEGYATEIGYTIGEIEVALKHLGSWMKPTRVRTPIVQQPGRAYVAHEPLGVVLVIAPWNYPVQLLLAPVVAAIAAGNCVLAKPSEVAPHTSAILARLVERYLDPAAVRVVEGGVDETTALLAERWDHVFYTGNGRVGRIVMEAAAKHLTPVTLELGGKSPAIVADDADIDVAARRIAWGKFLNAGQTCIAPDYVLVTRSREQELVDGIAAAIRAFYGADPSRSPDYGRIVNARHLDRLAGLLSGGRVVVGGDHDATTRYFAPTLLVDVDLDAPLMQEEIFGPILPVVPVDDVDTAIGFVNERDKPLALYVFSESRDVQDRVLAETSSGGACVNGTLMHIAVPDLPFGGVGPSGMGAYHGRTGFETFSHARGVLTKSTRLDPPVAYPPYTSLKERLVRRFL